MSNWVTPVYDRTEADILNKTEKAMIQADDLNRIEGNIKYLRIQIASFGFSMSGLSKTWTIYGLPDLGDVERILDNAQELVDAYAIDPPAAIPVSLKTIEQVNHLEENLMCLKTLIDWTIHSVMPSGTCQAGQSMYLWCNNPLTLHNRDIGAHPVIQDLIGNEDMLPTSAKTLTGAINELIGRIL